MKKEKSAFFLKAARRTVAAGLAGCMILCGSVQSEAAVMKDLFDEHYYADMYPDLKSQYGYDREALWVP